MRNRGQEQFQPGKAKKSDLESDEVQFYRYLNTKFSKDMNADARLWQLILSLLEVE